MLLLLLLFLNNYLYKYIALLFVNLNFILNAERFIHIFMFPLLFYTSNKYIHVSI